MVAFLLLGVAGEADVLSLVLEGNVMQYDGDVILFARADKLHPLMIYFHIWFYSFCWDDGLTELREKIVSLESIWTINPHPFCMICMKISVLEKRLNVSP